ncbi:DUF4317 domain-containing protein [Desulfosporosinus meridiei]|uniref:DUF4317 family protein n=1 Tax=Desulfosporosinus meridiei (strain ATCC BAA-275 / DSM 13257 / KCTC 12902 / NCIMB 13706 / S10) TaxID=768704 RepID=J7IRB7_DESMD|nr:DUF4317 domain-containing protein [Desulfosporosinus meridiei]AFQ44195.1 hypothetical protein Desmer_2259 [Desulfosporosinus meridiei DSM 13257]
MNKEDLASIRRELKVNNSKLNLQEICSYYIKQESKDILCSEVLYFAMMDEEKKELFLKNFKKVLSGKIDSKTFELEFKDNKLGQNSTQRNMLDTLKTEDFREATFKIVNKILAETCEIYDKDFMISFVRGEVYKSIKKDNDEIDDEKAYSLGFFIGSICPIVLPKKALNFDFEEREFKTSVPMNVTINTDAPYEGFMFPSFSEDAAETDKVVYYTQKENQPNQLFVENVLDCELKLTAEADKARFLEVVRDVVGTEIEPEVVSNIYTEIGRRLEVEAESGEVSLIGLKDMERILESSGIATEDKLQSSFLEIMGAENYEFKASSLAPNFKTKSIKIDSGTASITIGPEDLKNVKQVTKDGIRYLMIRIDDAATLEGFDLVTEEL